MNDAGQGAVHRRRRGAAGKSRGIAPLADGQRGDRRRGIGDDARVPVRVHGVPAAARERAHRPIGMRREAGGLVRPGRRGPAERRECRIGRYGEVARPVARADAEVVDGARRQTAQRHGVRGQEARVERRRAAIGGRRAVVDL